MRCSFMSFELPEQGAAASVKNLHVPATLRFLYTVLTGSMLVYTLLAAKAAGI